MKYRKYIVVTFIATMFLPLLSAKAEKTTEENFSIKSVVFMEQEAEVNLDFDTSQYLPDGFNAYGDDFSVESLNYMEDDSIDLGFDTSDYLPEDFNPYSN